MDKQIDCLKCGKLGVRKDSLYIDRRSEKKIGVLRNVMGGGLLVSFGGLFLWMAMDTLIKATRNFGDYFFILFCFTIATPSLVLGIELIIRHLKADKTRLFQYRCGCGHQWEQWEDGWDSASCPKCSKSMVTTHIFPLNPQDPKERKRPDRTGKLIGGSLTLAIGIGLLGLAISFWIGTPVFEGLLYKLALSFLVASLGLTLLRGGASSIRQYYGKNWVKLFMYQCAVCGYLWERREDEEDLSKLTSEEPMVVV